MKHPREAPFGLLRAIAGGVLRLFPFEVRGLAHLETLSGSAILAGNHTGLLDSLPLLHVSQTYFRFLMTEEVFQWGILGKVVPFGNILPIYKGREGRAMAEALRLLRHGGRLCIFPEGRLTQDGQMNPFQDGAAFLAERSKAAILPFVIHGGFEAWPQWRRWPHFRKIILEFAPVLAVEGLSRQEITARLQQTIQAMKCALEAEEAQTLHSGNASARHFALVWHLKRFASVSRLGRFVTTGYWERVAAVWRFWRTE